MISSASSLANDIFLSGCHCSALLSQISLSSPSQFSSDRERKREQQIEMAAPPPPFYPHVYVLLLLFAISSPSLAVDIAALLAAYPNLSFFTQLLNSTSITGELAARSSLTIPAIPNACFQRDLAGSADVFRYHVLLQYLSWSDLHRVPAHGQLVTTLFQATGRASGNVGAVNLTRDDADGITARLPAPFHGSSVRILGSVGILPYNVSVIAVDGLLLPYGSDLAAAESRSPVGLNVTRVLVDGHSFNVAAAMLEASGVAEEFEADQRRAGITVFVPTDEAFADLPATERLQSLPAGSKAVLLRFHVLRSYYPLGSLESIVNPVQPTLATEATAAGRFTLNITRVNGSVAIDTGVVRASITRTVFDQNPVAVFAVSKVLLPREIFARKAAQAESAAPPSPVGWR